MQLIKYYCIAILVLGLPFLTEAQQGAILFEKGQAEHRKGNYEEAITLFTKGLVFADEYYGNNCWGRAYAYLKLGEVYKAKKDIKEGLKTEKTNSDQTNSKLFWISAELADYEGNKNLEIEFYRKAISYTPNDLRVKTNLAYVLINNDQYEEGLSLLDEVILAYPYNAFAYNNRAQAHLEKGNLHEAKIDLEKSKRLDPNNPFLYRNYYTYYLLLDDPKKACRAIHKALKLDILKYGEKEDQLKFTHLRDQTCQDFPSGQKG